MLTTADLVNVVNQGRTQLNVPYRLGSPAGRSIWSAAKQALFDCSGFVAWSYYQATGVKLPAFTDALANDPRLTEVRTPQIGDIVLFKFSDPHQPGVVYPHTAIYAGNGQVLESGSADGSRSAVNYMPLLTSLNPHFFHLNSITANPPVVGPSPVPGAGNDPAPATPFDPTLPAIPLQPAVTGAPGGGVQLAQAGPFAINIPTGLVLGVIAALLLIIGAALFAFNVQNRITNAVSSNL